MLTILAAMCLGRSLSLPPRYKARFVDLSKFNFASNIQIYDARADGSAVGYTYMAMVDVAPASPLMVLRGTPVGMRSGAVAGDENVLWPYRLLGPDRVAAFYSSYPSFDLHGKYVRAKVSGTKLIRQPGTEVFRLPTQALKFAEPVAYGKTPSWLLGEVKRLSRAGYEDRCDTLTARGSAHFDYVNVTYYPITEGYDTCMHDAERHLPALKFGGSYRFLKDFVEGAQGYELGEIVWASNEGWLVVAATTGTKSGLLWLTPTS